MRRFITLSVATLIGSLALASAASAQIFVRAPFVRVETGGGGTYVRAPFSLYGDAGYAEAVACAKEQGLKLPMLGA